MPRDKKRIYNFDESIEDFMIYCTNKDLAKKTLKSYETTLKLFAKWLADELKIFSPKDVTTKNIKEYLEFTKTKGKYTYVANEKTLKYNNPTNRGDFGKQVSLYTVNNYLRNIKVFFTFLYDTGVLKENPTTPLKQYKHSRKPKNEIKDIDFNKLLNAMDLTLFSEYRDYVIVQLLMDTGMRIGECLAMERENVLVDKKAIFIPAEINKGRKDRYVFFGTKMQVILKRWINYKERYTDTVFVFPTAQGTQLNLTHFEKNLKKYCDKAKLKETITCHQIRNNFARRFLLSGGDIFILSKILGHSSVTVTEQAYLDVTQEDIRKKYIKYSPLENFDRNRG